MDHDEIRKKINENVYSTRDKLLEGNASKRFKSPIWSICHEILDEDGKLVPQAIYCIKCKRVFKYNSRSNGTTQILNHGCLNNVNQTKIDGFGTTKKNIAQTDKDKLKESAVSFVSKDLRPFEALSGDGLFDLLKVCVNIGAKYGNLEDSELKSLIPNPPTVSRWTGEIAKVLREALYRELYRIVTEAGIAFTTDVWTDNFRQLSYLVITAHFVDSEIGSEKLVLRDQTICLNALDVCEKKTGQYLAEVINYVLEEIGIIYLKDKMVLVTDRGTNIISAGNILKINRLNCYDHLLNNVVGHVCKIDLIEAVLKPVRSLVKFIKIGGHNNKLKKGLKSHCPTRWNTQHAMGSSVEENFDQLEIILDELNESHRLTAINRLYLKEILGFLRIFNSISVEMEKSHRPTLFLVWPATKRIDKFLKPTQIDSVLLQKMKNVARSYLKKNKLHRIATFLHPQLKSLEFVEESERLQAIRDTKEMISTITVSQTNAERTLRRKNSNDSVISECFDDDFECDEVDLYSGHRVTPSNDMDILECWQQNRESFLKLYQMAMNIQAIPATSAPSERKFSLAGKIINCLRSSLDPAKVNDLLFLYSDSDKFDSVSDDL